MEERESNQLLHLVFGGELKDVAGTVFKDPAKLDIVGVFPNYRTAYNAWKKAAQSTVDNAQMRYFVVHIHRLMEPAARPAKRKAAKRRPARKPAAKR